MSFSHSSERGIRRILAVMLFSLSMIFMAASDASAQQPCDPGACNQITIYNCTEMNFQVSFRLCCDGNVVQTPLLNAPAVPCPNPSATYNFGNCTIIGIAGFNPPLPANIEAKYDPANCRMIIRYK